MKNNFAIYNDGHIVAYASSKSMCEEIINDLPCFCKSAIEVRKIRQRSKSK